MPDAEIPCQENRKEGDRALSSFYREDCAFCPANKRVDIIAETKDAYLTKVVKAGVTLEDRFFIIPKEHLISYFSLPTDWQSQSVDLLRRISPKNYLEKFNLSWNFGEEAGQRVEHIHMWVILRSDGLDIGLSTMIDELLQRRNADKVAVQAAPRPRPYHEPDDPQF